MKEHTKRLLFNFIFNIAETLVILLMGIALKLPKNLLIMIILTFLISRGCFGKPLHYKTWYRCLIFSSLIFLGLFVLLKVDVVLSTLFAIFSALIMTGRSNINDMYLWNNKGELGKYYDIVEFIKYNELDDKLLEFEKKVKDRDNLEYLIYKYRFKEGKTFDEIKELLNYTIENPRIVEHLDRIAFALRLYCGI